MNLLQYAICSAVSLGVASAQFDYPGYGQGRHSQPRAFTEGGGLVTELSKGEAVYQLFYKPDHSAVITKDGGGALITMDTKYGASLKPAGMLVDIHESDDSILLLMVTSRHYRFIEYVKKFPELAPPENDSFLNIELPYQDRKWKPYRYVDFVLKGMDPLLFVDQVKSIKGVKIIPGAGIEIINKDSVREIYKIADDEMKLGGDFCIPLRYSFRRKLESEFISSIKNMTDEQLIEVSKKHYMHKGNELSPEFSRILSSLSNQNAAGEIRQRILKASSPAREKGRTE